MRKRRHVNSYTKAYEDIDFLKLSEARPVRLQLELLKPEVILQEHKVHETIVCFGSARVKQAAEIKKDIAGTEAQLKINPKDEKLRERLNEQKGLLEIARYYDMAVEFGSLVIKKGRERFAVATGGGPGLMEASNKGAFTAGGKSIGFNITLPMEQFPNPYISKNLAFLFHYFAIRKMHLVMRSKAIVVFPGGFGTFDEVFEILTLVQTGKKDRIPVIFVGKKFWNEVINIPKLAHYGVISTENLNMFEIVDSAKDAWDIIAKFYKIR
ncbi:lysine decarboxylase [Bacteroidia bacterium]|nr:lysine decarboxylase [Bacteroidia bacterium]